MMLFDPVILLSEDYTKEIIWNAKIYEHIHTKNIYLSSPKYPIIGKL